MPVRPTSPRAALDAWSGRSISNRITASAVSLTLAVALGIGGSTFVAVRYLLARNASASLEARARLVEARLAQELELALRDTVDLAQNSFVANGLVDSLGRETYLLPFLREHRSSTGTPVTLLLADYRGAPLASSDPRGAAAVGPLPGISEALRSRRTEVRIAAEEDGGASVVIAAPVLFPPTGQVEGVLAARYDAQEFLAAAASVLGPRDRALLAIGRLQVGPPAPFELAVSRPLQVRPELASLAPVLTVGTLDDVRAPLRWVAAAYLLVGLGTVLVVLRLSRRMAARIAEPIGTLSETAARVASGGVLSVEVPGAGRGDEVGELARALAAMLERLRASHEELERRVEERTAALTQRERELERFAATQAVLLREVNHRVKNNLAAIIGVLHLEERRAEQRTDGSIREVLGEMEARIRSLATVHALLSSVEWQPLPVEGLCRKILQSSLDDGTGRAPEVRTASSAARIESGQAHHLALALNELATNTQKHGRREGEPARVEVAIDEAGGEVVLTYRDGGAGFPAAVLAGDPAALGTGLQLLRGIVETSMKGRLVLANDRGALVTIRFPAQGGVEPGVAA